MLSTSSQELNMPSFTFSARSASDKQMGFLPTSHSPSLLALARHLARRGPAAGRFFVVAGPPPRPPPGARRAHGGIRTTSVTTRRPAPPPSPPYLSSAGTTSCRRRAIYTTRRYIAGHARVRSRQLPASVQQFQPEALPARAGGSAGRHRRDGEALRGRPSCSARATERASRQPRIAVQGGRSTRERLLDRATTYLREVGTLTVAAYTH